MDSNYDIFSQHWYVNMKRESVSQQRALQTAEWDYYISDDQMLYNLDKQTHQYSRVL